MEQDGKFMRESARSLYVGLFLLFLTVYGAFVVDVGPNQLSRLNLTLALAHEGRLEIDTYTANSIDRAFYNGHYYSDKAPLSSFLAYPVYQGIRALQHLDNVNLDTRLMLTYLLWVINGFINVPLTALLLLLFLFMGRTMRPRSTMPWWVTFVLAFGTFLFPYATMYFGHNLAAFFGFAPFVIAFLVRQGRLSERWLFGAGLLAGLGVLAEYPNGLFALALVVYVALTQRRMRAVGWVVLGGIGPALALAAYNTLAFDSPLRLSYMYHAAPWGGEHRRGLLGVQWPSLARLWAITFSPKGLFFLSPVTLLAPFAYVAMWRDRRYRAEFWLSLGIPLLFALLNSGYFYTLGGSSPGPRFLVPTLPFLFLPYVFLSEGWAIPLALLGAVSAGVQLLIILVNPLVGRFANPLFEYWGPRALAGKFRTGLALHHRYAAPYSIALGLVLMAMLAGPVVTWLWLRLDGARRCRLARHFLAVALVAYLLLAFPIDLKQPTRVPPFYLQPSPPVRDNPP